eukprot:Lithocolla_globosa_v1_NODE_40_length_8230_cov_45.875581.p3 type:complete len:151 gc:universal NODE_40_length_8230_cov_45.875581:2791-3243(+)
MERYTQYQTSTTFHFPPHPCNICFESWPGMNISRSGFCSRCQRDNHVIKLWSAENNMVPMIANPVDDMGDLPSMTDLEQMLIARVMPFMSVYRLVHGQTGFSGNVINFPQYVSQVATVLPRLSSETGVVIVRRNGRNGAVTKIFGLGRAL